MALSDVDLARAELSDTDPWLSTKDVPLGLPAVYLSRRQTTYPGVLRFWDGYQWHMAKAGLPECLLTLVTPNPPTQYRVLKGSSAAKAAALIEAWAESK